MASDTGGGSGPGTTPGWDPRREPDDPAGPAGSPAAAAPDGGGTGGAGTGGDVGGAGDAPPPRPAGATRAEDATTREGAPGEPPSWSAPGSSGAPGEPQSWSAPGATPPPPPPGWAPPPGGPGGYGAPGGGYAPPPGQAYGGQGPSPSNGLAIGALVVGIIALLGAFLPFVGILAILPGLVALVLGVLGLRKAGQIGTGRGMAIGGLVCGILAILGGIAWIVATVFFAQAADDLQIDDIGSEFGVPAGDSTALQVGECFDDGDADTAVPCSAAHDNEIFARVGSGESCSADVFEEFVGTDYGSSRYFTSDLDAADGSDETVCALYVPDEQITGTAEGTGT